MTKQSLNIANYNLAKHDLTNYDLPNYDLTNHDLPIRLIACTLNILIYRRNSAPAFIPFDVDDFKAGIADHFAALSFFVVDYSA